LRKSDVYNVTETLKETIISKKKKKNQVKPLITIFYLLHPEKKKKGKKINMQADGSVLSFKFASICFR